MSANPRAVAARRVVVLFAVLSCGRGPSRESVESQELTSGGPEVLVLHGDVSGPLRDLPAVVPVERTHREKPLFPFRAHGPAQHVVDPVLQAGPGPFVATTAGLNFAGVGNGDYGFVPNAAPPDTEGAIGATQYVQWVNESFAVFDKATGAIVYGPAAGNTLWKGFGGGCETNNDGDPIAQYDKAANRWVLTQFSVSTTPYLQCFAISTTSDATGTWFRYSLSMPNFPDYPKLGVWPDGYYLSFNMFKGNLFVGGRACAIDRSKMLTGAPATAVCFQLGTSFGGLLPSDLDGPTPPASGSPDYFLAFGTNVLQLWKFHADFVTTSNSTFAGPTSITVAPFSEACSGGTCIPQGGASQLLDSLGDRLMYRLAYRNFGDHEAIVANHSVTAGSSVGVRWYELRNPGGTPSIFQSGTFAPDSSYRWMGSIAMDHSGDVALGYSLSSSTMNPSIAYTGRAPTDPLGVLQAETVLLTGGGSQNGGLNRWGDYSALTVDPVDDCTFWYTNEYLKATGSFNWSTRIASFKFPGCTSAANSPPTVVNPASASPNPVSGTTTNLSVLGADDGGEANLTYTWSSAGPAAVAFSANGTNAAKNTTATFSKTGSYTFTATIKDQGGLTTTSSVAVTVNATLTSIGVSPASATVPLNGQQQFTAAPADQFGNAMTAAVTWSASGGGAIDATGLFTAGSTAGGPFTVTAANGGVSGTASVTVANTAPTVATPASANPNPVTGTTTSLSVLGADDGGEANLTYTWSSSGPAAVTFSANGTNAAKNTTATLSKAGSYTFTASIKDAGGLTTTSAVAVAVNQTVTSIAVSPASATVSLNGQQQFTATASDQFGNPISGASFTWTVGGGGTISATGLFTAGSTAGGPFTVTAASGGVSGTASVTVVNAAPTVAAPASANPNPVAGTTTNLSVLGADDGGEANLTYTWSSVGPGAAGFGANGTNAAKNTTATFTAAGGYTFTATIRDAGGLTATSSVAVTVNQVVTSITVSPASATVTVNGTQQFTASAADQFGNAIGGASFAWTVSGGGTIDATGLFTATVAGGPFTVTASSGGVSGTASVTVRNNPPTVAVPASANPNPVAGTTTALSVLGAYDGGEAALTYTWSAAGPAAVSFSANGTNAAKNTTATFSAFGTYTFTATIADSGGQSTTSSVTVSVSQTLSVKVSPAAASVAEGGTQQFTASEADQFGTPVAASPFTWTVSGGGTIDATGLFTAGFTPGTFTVTATNTDGSGTASVTVGNTPPTVATPASANPNPTGGTTTSLSVLGADDGGEANLTYTWSATGPAAVTFSANGTNAAKNTIATFTAAGSYTFTATITDAGGLTATSSVSVSVVSSTAAVAVSPSSATVPLNGSQQFSASATDQFGQPIATSFTWTVSGGGTISASGFFTAGSTPGTFAVTASSGGASGTASVTVVNNAPSVATAASANPNPVTGTTASLSVLGADDGGEANLTYTWSAIGPSPVAFSANGTNAAKSTTATFSQAGSYTFTATIRDAFGLSTTSSVSVAVSQTTSSIAVSPASASVTVNGTQQFTASASDQFGSPMSATFTWTVSGGGTIGSTGLFAAGATAGGPFTVTAASGGISGTASVTVTDFTVSATPSSRTVRAGGSAQYTVTVTRLSGFAPAVTLSVSGLPAGSSASFTPSSTSSPATLTVTTAGAGHTGTYALTIAGAGGGLTRSTTVTLTISQH